MPVALDRPGRPFFAPDKQAVLWRAVDAAQPATVIGVGVEVTALAALEGKRDLDGDRAAQAFANHLADIEACASAKYHAAGEEGRRVILLDAGDLSEAIERNRLRRTMKQVSRGR